MVCGGRDYADRDTVFRVLDWMHAEKEIAVVIHGAASGADTLADAWAKARGIETMPFDAQWKKHGKSAGPIRNRQMIVSGKPDAVVAFPGGRGTANMIDQARNAGISVWPMGEGKGG